MKMILSVAVGAFLFFSVQSQAGVVAGCENIATREVMKVCEARLMKIVNWKCEKAGTISHGGNLYVVDTKVSSTDVKVDKISFTVDGTKNCDNPVIRLYTDSDNKIKSDAPAGGAYCVERAEKRAVDACEKEIAKRAQPKCAYRGVTALDGTNVFAVDVTGTLFGKEKQLTFKSDGTDSCTDPVISLSAINGHAVESNGGSGSNAHQQTK